MVDRAHLRELLARATIGPWASSAMEDEWGHVWKVCGNDGKGTYIAHVYTDIKARTPATTVKWQENRRANLNLIAAAHNALPELLNALDAAEAEVARLREAIDKVGYAAATAEYLPDLIDELGRIIDAALKHKEPTL